MGVGPPQLRMGQPQLAGEIVRAGLPDQKLRMNLPAALQLQAD